MEKYDHKKVEAKQQQKWWDADIDKVGSDPTKPKCYVLDMFPYPSGEGLHVGHPKGYIATDIYSRMKKMQGYNILHPMGWDAFGLPAENYALKNKIHPKVAVEKNIATFKSQLKKIGFNYDWEREINTTDPEYYKWTQWIFLKLFEKGLAYESHEPINWCPSCQTGLANEDLENGKCERCGSEVEKKPMRQWVLKITDYADRLLADLDLPELKWPEHIKESQRHWIGKSVGAEIEFKLKAKSHPPDRRAGKLKAITVFTTRPDTIYGATFMAISPELADEWLEADWQASKEVKKYVADTLATRAKQTYKDNPEKTGVFSGLHAINPANEEEIPVWITNYVLGDIGTGAIMAVPVHDERDREFAEKFNLPISEAGLVDGDEVIKKWGLKRRCGINLKIGCLVANDIGASRFRLSIAISVAPSRYRRAICRLSCRRWLIMSQAGRASHRSLISPTGSTPLAPSAAGRANARLTPCRNGPARLGITWRMLVKIQKLKVSRLIIIYWPKISWITGNQWTFMSAGPSTPLATSFMPAFGTNSSKISVLSAILNHLLSSIMSA